MEDSPLNKLKHFDPKSSIGDSEKRRVYMTNQQQQQQQQPIYYNNTIPEQHQQQHIQNPNYFYINYNHSQLDSQSSYASNHGQFFQLNSSTMPMDTDNHQNIYSNKETNRHMSSSLISTPESTPSVSSLSTTSSNSSSSLSINNELHHHHYHHKMPNPHHVSNYHQRSLVADLYDMSGQKVLSASSSSQQQQHHKKFIRNYQQKYQRPPYLNQMDSGGGNGGDGDNSLESGATRLKRSSESSFNSSSLPKYVKPKICKSSLIVQSVSSKRVAKPQPQLATMPPFSYNLGNGSGSSGGGGGGDQMNKIHVSLEEHTNSNNNNSNQGNFLLRH